MIAATGFVHPEYLIDTGRLARELGDPLLCVFDCTTHLIPDPKVVYHVVPGREDFAKGHIPGAQFIDIQKDLSDSSHRFRFMLPSAEQFAAVMGHFGVGEKSRVVLYSTANPWWATRVWWLLRVFGFDKAALLDGGWQKWRREGRPIETGPAKPRPPAQFPVRAPKPLMVGHEEVLRAIGDPRTCTINALLPAQHAGTGGTSYGRPGRIKGSVNMPAAELFDPATGELRAAEELRRRFAETGALDKRVITYCGGGIAASADALALVMLGHEDVRLYDASLSEWATDPALPMETG